MAFPPVEAKQARLLPNRMSVVFRWPQGGGSPEVEAGLAADLVSLLSRPGRLTAADSRLRCRRGAVAGIGWRDANSDLPWRACWASRRRRSGIASEPVGAIPRTVHPEPR